MAKRRNRSDRKSGRSGSETAVAEAKRPVSKSKTGVEASRQPRRDRDASGSSGAASTGGSPEKRGFFDIYKPGQGRNTRVWSAVGAGSLVVWFAYFLYEKLSILERGVYTQVIQVGAAVAVVLVFGLTGYYVLGLNKRVNDFLIATEGEMKKVNWSSRKDTIGSTKVVIFLVVSLSIMLFVVDLFFMTFFNYIGVLKGASFLEAIRDMF